MKNNYTKQQIEEILNVLTNPEEFQEFIRKMYELCNHKEELPEDGSFFAPITDDVYEAIYLYKHPEEAKKKYQKIEDILNSEMARRIAEEEQMIEEGLIAEEEFYQWYDSLTPEQLEEYYLTGRVTK